MTERSSLSTSGEQDRSSTQIVRYEYPAQWASGDDEISIPDLLRKLGRRWYWIAGCTLLAITLAIAYTMVRTPVYEYSASVAIGYVPEGTNAVPLEPTPDTIVRLNNALVPLAVREAIMDMPPEERPAPPPINVEIAPGSRIIRLRTEGSEQREPLFVGILSDTLARLDEEHERLYRNAVGRHEGELEKARIALTELEDDRLFERKLDQVRARIDQAENWIEQLDADREQLAVQFDHLDEYATLLSERRNRLERYLDSTSTDQRAAIEQTEGPNAAMSMLLIGQQIQDTRSRLDEVEEALAVEIPDQRARLQADLLKNQSDRELQAKNLERLEQELQTLVIQRQQEIRTAEADIRAAENRIASIMPTRIISEPLRSLRTIGTSNALIVAIATLLGLMAGVFLALLIGAFDTPAREAHASGGDFEG